MPDILLFTNANHDIVVAVNPRVIVGTGRCTVTERPLIAVSNLERTVRKLPCVEHRITDAFERAIEGKNPEQLLRLATRHRSFIEQYPACLLLADKEGKTLVHRMAASGYTLLIRKALNTEQGKRAVCAKDHNDDMGLHHAARAQTAGCLDVIIASGAGAQLLLEQNKEGYPLEALKIEALSYKLRMNETEQQLLQEVYSLICHRHYQEAMDYLDDHKIALDALRFINDQQQQALSAVSVRSLLNKGVQKRLGTLERIIDQLIDLLLGFFKGC